MRNSYSSLLYSTITQFDNIFLYSTKENLEMYVHGWKEKIITYNICKFKELPTEIKDAPTVPTFARGLNKFYAFYAPAIRRMVEGH